MPFYYITYEAVVGKLKIIKRPWNGLAETITELQTKGATIVSITLCP